MVRFANTLAIELKEGFWINRLKFVLLCLCFALLSVQFLNQYDVTSDIVDGAIVQLSGQGRFTAGDVLFSYFRGVRVESVSSQGLFAFPIGWFALQMVVAAIVGYYPVRHDGYDYQLALRSSSRIVIAVCRLIWIVLVVLSVFILGVVMSAFTAFLAGDLVFGLSPSMLNAMYGASMTIFDPCQSVIFLRSPRGASFLVRCSGVRSWGDGAGHRNHSDNLIWCGVGVCRQRFLGFRENDAFKMF